MNNVEKTSNMVRKYLHLLSFQVLKNSNNCLSHSQNFQSLPHPGASQCTGTPYVCDFTGWRRSSHKSSVWMYLSIAATCANICPNESKIGCSSLFSLVIQQPIQGHCVWVCGRLLDIVALSWYPLPCICPPKVKEQLGNAFLGSAHV